MSDTSKPGLTKPTSEKSGSFVSEPGVPKPRSPGVGWGSSVKPSPAGMYTPTSDDGTEPKKTSSGFIAEPWDVIS